MMTAITEVEVSKESKMRKIEETEAIKMDLLARHTGRWGGLLPADMQTRNKEHHCV
jgi:hypothetical protein